MKLPEYRTDCDSRQKRQKQYQTGGWPESIGSGLGDSVRLHVRHSRISGRHRIGLRPASHRDHTVTRTHGYMTDRHRCPDSGCPHKGQRVTGHLIGNHHIVKIEIMFRQPEPGEVFSRYRVPHQRRRYRISLNRRHARIVVRTASGQHEHRHHGHSQCDESTQHQRPEKMEKRMSHHKSEYSGIASKQGHSFIRSHESMIPLPLRSTEKSR